jgi:hypothetical protein
MKGNQRYTVLRIMLVLAAMLLTQACAHNFSVPPESPLHVYAVEGEDQTVPRRWAPLFAAHGFEEMYNRIGRPVTCGGAEARDEDCVRIDTSRPTMYVMQRAFATERGIYTNLIYRVHFPRVPYSLVPFHLTAGRNVGLLVVITLDGQGRPVLVTTVHTCGCYLAIVPTNFLDPSAYPEHWREEPLSVYGETLPPRLDFGAVASPGLLVHLRPGVHRVMDLAVVPARSTGEAPYEPIPMQMADMGDLEHLPAPAGPVSFYYEAGVRKGYVKGAFKPLETLMLGLISLDFFVGTDKVYGDPAIWDNPFYTSLKPWRRRDSDMWHFADFLHYWGWRL